MKNKKKNWILFLGLYFFVWLFILPKNCWGEGHLIINEIYSSGNNDWIEIYNPTNENVDLTDYKIYKAVSSSQSLVIRIGDVLDGIYSSTTVLPPKEYYLIVRDNASDDLKNKADAIGIKDSFTWNSSGYTLYLNKVNGRSSDIVDEVGFGEKANFYEKEPFLNASEGKSLGRKDFIDTDNNSNDFYISSSPTPGGKNEFEEPEEEDGDTDEDVEEIVYNSNIRLNEILPNPKGKDGKDNEYIEIYNSENEEINLEGWILKDSSKSGKFTFTEEYKIEPKSYLVIYKKDFKFAINNSKESIYLLDPNEKIVSSTSFIETAKEGISYGVDDNDWRWSKYLTPGKKNKFSSKIKFDLKEIKSGYANVPIKFEVKMKKKNKAKSKLKYRWDFDDGRKSYVESPSHTFYEAGKFRISLTLDNGIETKEESFSIKIKKYPRYDVSIYRLSPNPTGKDSDNEWIEVKNNEKKEINLKDWKIATGKNLTNHSITNDIIVLPGEIVRLTRADAPFSFNNKEATIKLRYPDKKSTSKIEYKKDKIEDDEICQNVNGICFWYFSKKESAENEDVQKDNNELAKNEKENYLANIPLSNNDNIVFLEIGKIKGSVYKSGNDYKFTPNGKTKPHWAVNIFRNIF